MLAEPAEPTVDYIKKHLVKGTWGAAVCEIMNLRELVLEFEIDERKRSQLDAVVERAKAWKFPLAQEDFVLEWSGGIKWSSWEGIRELKEEYHFLKESPVADDLPKRICHVATMVWSAKEVQKSEKEESEVADPTD